MEGNIANAMLADTFASLNRNLGESEWLTNLPSEGPIKVDRIVWNKLRQVPDCKLFPNIGMPNVKNYTFEPPLTTSNRSLLHQRFAT